MRRFTFFLILLFLLTLSTGVQSKEAAQSIASGKRIWIMQPTAKTTWVVGEKVVVRWIRGKHPWMRVTIKMTCQVGSGWGAIRIPVLLAKNVPDTGYWSGILKKPPKYASSFYVEITRGIASGVSKSFSIVNKK